MYRANLSHRQLERYLEYLEKNGMLEEVADGKVNLFQITEKGIEFLKDYGRMSRYL
jgi:predicted transcriptional regulator